jgi:cholesterol transport system auxiliary component
VHIAGAAHRHNAAASSLRFQGKPAPPVWLLACLLMPLLAGCSLLVGGSRERATIYAPDPQVQADPAWPQVAWQLSITRPDAARMVDSLRIAVRPAPGELQVYKGASWAKTPSQQVEDTVLRVLEDSGKIAGVARQGSGVAADYKLVMDLRRYEADYAGNAVPSATIEINAKLMHAPANEIVGSRTFLQALPAGATDTGSVTQAFSQALGGVAVEVAGWTLATGEAHERKGPHGAAP